MAPKLVWRVAWPRLTYTTRSLSLSSACTDCNSRYEDSEVEGDEDEEEEEEEEGEEDGDAEAEDGAAEEEKAGSSHYSHPTPGERISTRDNSNYCL